MKLHDDDNAKEIIAALRAEGATVERWVGSGRQAGLPDIVCGYRGTTFLFEIKAAKGKPEASQETFHSKWKGGPIVTIRTVPEALAALGVGIDVTPVPAERWLSRELEAKADEMMRAILGAYNRRSEPHDLRSTLEVTRQYLGRAVRASVTG